MSKYASIKSLVGGNDSDESIKDAIITHYMSVRHFTEAQLEAELIKYRLYELLLEDGWIDGIS